mmetsp:Transcript_4836/g.18078  ORF Transcript_4836/g.18078 Transcript_4836/m.18078 type:complete len:184 (-) Transcript_4836:2776-3327(-)
MTQFTLTHPEHPHTQHKIALYYLHNCLNLPQFIQNVIKGQFPETLVLVDSTKILSTNHIQVAIYNALFKSKSQKRLKTIQTQILYNLSDSKNFSQSLSTFGAKESECFLVGVDCEITPHKIREWLGDNVGIVEELREMDAHLEKNGSAKWVRESMFGGLENASHFPKSHLESMLLTQLSVKDL